MVDIHDAGLKVRYLWGVMGRNSEMLYTNLLQNITQDLTPVKPCLVEGIPDMWIWNHSVSGVYTTKSAYAWLSNVQVGDGVLSRRGMSVQENCPIG
ncbi:hypothetical protein JHK86_053405 [Glycine max]|nr:hypothetical protein JHK86_053405 [Glycine max]